MYPSKIVKLAFLWLLLLSEVLLLCVLRTCTCIIWLSPLSSYNVLFFVKLEFFVLVVLIFLREKEWYPNILLHILITFFLYFLSDFV